MNSQVTFSKCSQSEIDEIKSKYNLKLSWAIAPNAFKAVIDTSLVGLVDFDADEKCSYQFITIHSFEVLKKGCGVGSLVFEAFLEQLGCHDIYLSPDNEICKSFWIKYGFSPCDGSETPRYLRKGVK